MKSNRYWAIKIEPIPHYKNKYWVRVYVLNGRLIPLFEFVYYLLKSIGFCEDKKYPAGKGKHMVTDFATDTLESGLIFEELRNKYRIPQTVLVMLVKLLNIRISSFSLSVFVFSKYVARSEVFRINL